MEPNEELFFVVKNHEDQYSIWPEYKEVPDGWETVGDANLKANCLDYIRQHWTDMRPKGLREKMSTTETG